MDYEVHMQARDANVTLAAEAARVLASHQSDDPDDEDFLLVSNEGVAAGWL
jgi:hypothetical protein